MRYDGRGTLAKNEGAQGSRSLDQHRAVDDYLGHHNADPKPFVWTKPVDTILDKVSRAKQTLESMH